jgi:hypothetical protein
MKFVVYRQSRRSGGAVPSEFIQVSPLIDDMFCRSDSPADPTPLARLDDPFIKLSEIVQGDPWEGHRLLYLDRYPHEMGIEYRYQLVFFDLKGEITEYRTSDWVLAQ